MGEQEEKRKMRTAGMNVSGDGMASNAKVMPEVEVRPEDGGVPRQNAPIMFDGKVYQDLMYINSKVKLGFWRRLQGLWMPEIEVSVMVYVVGVMPDRTSVMQVVRYSFWDKWKEKYLRRKHRSMVQEGIVKDLTGGGKV